MKPLAIAVGMVLAGLLIGCGDKSGDGDGPCPAGATLSIAPKTRSVTAGGPAVAFYANLTNCTEMVAWTLTGPGSIDSALGTPVNYTPPASVASVTTATLTISAGGLSDAATITISP